MHNSEGKGKFMKEKKTWMKIKEGACARADKRVKIH